LSSDLPGVNPATLNGVILYYRLMTKWSGLGDSTELSRMGLSQGLTAVGRRKTPWPASNYRVLWRLVPKRRGAQLPPWRTAVGCQIC
jgi:hypothetical protein